MTTFKIEQVLKLEPLYEAALAQLQPRLESEITATALPSIREHVIQAIDIEPPPSAHPFVWSLDRAANNRARRKYFSLIRRGKIPTDGVRYKRSGKLRQNWQSTLQVASDTLLIDLINDANAAKFVYGNDDRDQIPGHATTGWTPINAIEEQAAGYAEEQVVSLWGSVVTSVFD